MKKIMFVFGTRPEVIKLAPLIDLFSKDKDNFDVKVCNTGQHKEMVNDLINLFNIDLDYNLNVMKKNQTLATLTSEIILGFNSNIDYNPDYIFVLGDTITAFTASLYAYQNKIHLCHVEGGLRTDNIYSPWPEEGYRKMIAQIAYLHFAPTSESKDNLIKENVNTENIYVTGNTVIDALQNQIENIENSKDLKKSIINNIEENGYIFSDRKIILVTSHRRENFGNGIENICLAIKKLANDCPELDFVFPVHLNPNIQRIVYDILNKIDNIYLITPLAYEKFVYLMSASYIILTDSGGIQEEASFLGKPVLVMRDTTERVEAVNRGTLKLVGTKSEDIYLKTLNLLKCDNIYKEMSEAIGPYGEGDASKKILEIMKNV